MPLREQIENSQRERTSHLAMRIESSSRFSKPLSTKVKSAPRKRIRRESGRLTPG